ncbi:MAG: hypothetical protein EXQ57_01435 [Bryobacterales bacterium]|nr:hypothetical protein [Bryobacterales bacterium]
MSICGSSRASAITKRLAARLERNLGIATLLVEEDTVPVSETWEEGAAADAVLILLDGVSAPAPLRREAWTGLIEHGGHPPVAFSRLEECAYPKLLERRPFFPAAALERAVERWLAGMLPACAGIEPAAIEGAVPDEWWTMLVDEPGRVVTTDPAAAQAFAHQAAGHFQAVVWMGCAGREVALIRAELAYRLGAGRTLVVLAHIEKPLAIPIDGHSYLQVLGAPPETEGDPALGACYAPGFPGWFAKELGGDLNQAVLLEAANGVYRMPQSPRTNDETRQRHLAILHRYFQTWKKEPDPCSALLAEVPAAIQHGFAQDWTRGSELCRRAAFLLLGDGRRREGIRLLNRLLVEAEDRGDAETAADARHELSWLTDEDEPGRSGTTGGEQLVFALEGGS